MRSFPEMNTQPRYSFPLSQAPARKLLEVVEVRTDRSESAKLAAVGIQAGPIINVRWLSRDSCLARIQRIGHMISLHGDIIYLIRVSDIQRKSYPRLVPKR